MFSKPSEPVTDSYGIVDSPVSYLAVFSYFGVAEHVLPEETEKFVLLMRIIPAEGETVCHHAHARPGHRKTRKRGVEEAQRGDRDQRRVVDERPEQVLVDLR